MCCGTANDLFIDFDNINKNNIEKNIFPVCYDCINKISKNNSFKKYLKDRLLITINLKSKGLFFGF